MVIKQITENNQEIITFWGRPLNVVKLVAIVRNIDHSATKITYRLEDHTGQIDAHQWIEDNDTITTVQVLVNTYARVFGSVRNQGGGKTIMIFRLEPITSPNELTNHMLEVLSARFKGEEYSKKGDGMAGYTSEFSNGGSSFMGNATNQSSSTTGHPQGIDGEKLLIYEAIKHHTNEQGITTAELKRKFAHMPASKIR